MVCLGNATSFTYDAQGRVLTVTDARGFSTQNTYDAKGNLVMTQDALGGVTRFVYDAQGNMVAQTDAEGCTNEFHYDAFGYLVGEVRAAGRAEGFGISYGNDGNGRRLMEVRPKALGVNLVTRFVYDGEGRLVQTVHADNTVTGTVYDALGKAVAQIDQKGRSTDTTYDAMGRAVTVRYPDQTTEVSGYDNEGRRTSFKDRGGRITQTLYDGFGRPVTQVNADGTVRVTEYDAQGRVVAEVDERNIRTEHVYDEAGRRVRTVEAVGRPEQRVMEFEYDGNGNQTVVKVGGVVQQETVYDALNRPVEVRFADGTVRVTEYDKVGRVTARVDENGKRTEFEYDCLGRLVKVRQFDQGMAVETSYRYDAAGNLVEQVDGEGRSTKFEYDAMGRRTRRILPLGQSETVEYDATGNVVRKTTFRGETITFTYDEQTDRLLAKTLPDKSYSFGYDDAGRRTVMRGPEGETRFHYDSRDRLIRKVSPFGVLEYRYDDAGNLEEMGSNHAQGVTVTYRYDGLNRPVTVIDQRMVLGSQETVYSYDFVGNLESMTYPNGVKHEWRYNSKNQLTRLTISNIANLNVLKSFEYTLDFAGKRVRVVEETGRQVVWGYDDFYRLKSESIVNDPAGINGTVGYTYDRVGNRLTRTSTLPGIGSQDFVGDYDFNDRLLESRTYDNNGNTVTDEQGRTYVYDAENRLVRVTGSGLVIEYLYDADGNRIQKVVDTGSGPVTTRYLVDTNNLTGFAQVVEELDGLNNVRKRYTYGLDLISQTDVSTGQVRFFGYDGTGSTRLLFDESGNITDTYTYDAFGTLIQRTGATFNVYLFHGEQFDPDSGLYYLRARYMDTATGRFWTMDTFEGNLEDPASLHKYTFTANDPINKIDPSGFFTIAIPSVFQFAIRAILFDVAGSILVTATISVLEKIRDIRHRKKLYHYTDKTTGELIRASRRFFRGTFFTDEVFSSARQAILKLALVRLYNEGKEPNMRIRITVDLRKYHFEGPRKVRKQKTNDGNVLPGGANEYISLREIIIVREMDPKFDIIGP